MKPNTTHLLTPSLRAVLALAILCLSINTQAANGSEATAELQQRWAQIKYRLPDKQHEEAFEQLTSVANQFVTEHPKSAELLIWQGIILSTYAGEKGGLGALSLVDKAKQSFEQALEIDPKALSGSAYTSLGALYYQVPGWPLSFGNDKKARQLLEKALEIDPNGIDSNFFYADFLVDQKDYILARQMLDKAIMAPNRPHRPLADEGRRQEILNLLMKIEEKDA
ncbi:MAG: hypothetical protein V7752_13810 [Halopseudomonas sp.]